MKKIISIFLSIIITLSCLTPALVIYAKQKETRAIEHFSDECVEISHEYDEGKEFTAVDEEVDELDDLQFQTARLFIKSSSTFDKKGAEEAISGFLNWHLLQYSSAKEAKKAYKYYLEQSNIEAVEPDITFDVELNATDEINYITREEFDNDYAKNIMGTNDVLAYIKEHNIPTKKVRVGVLDSGIDYNHEIFEGRLFRTYFNATDKGDENDEYDITEANAHGTSVTSCVVSTSPDTVEVGCYKTLKDGKLNSETKSSWIISALLKAYSDNCNVLNMSFTGGVDEILQDTLDFLKSENVEVFAAAGNSNSVVTYKSFNESLLSNKSTISVSATDSCNRKAYFSNGSCEVKFSAPGLDVAAAYPDNKYRTGSGTSFSSPFAAGIFATLLSLNQVFSNEKLIDLMQYTCTDLFDVFRKYTVWYGTEFYGSGVVDAFSAFCELMNITKPSKVSFSKDSGDYRAGDTVELTCDDAEIYYTTDLSIPDKNNGVKYTEPIILEEDTVITAIAYSKDGIKGQSAYKYYFVFQLGTDDMFTIDDNGMITGYMGTITNLEIPETINGIAVKSMHCDLFNTKWTGRTCNYEGITHSKVDITSLKLPETIEYIQGSNFLDGAYINKKLQLFIARGLKEVNSGMLADCNDLMWVELPNVEKVGHNAFQGCGLRELSLPNCTSVGDMPFMETRIYHLYLPKLETAEDVFLASQSIACLDCPNLKSCNAFTDFYGDISLLSNIFLPNITSIDYFGLLDLTSTKRIEFSKIKNLEQFPIRYLSSDMKSLMQCRMILPSTLKNIDLGYQKGNVTEYIIYANQGTYAEQWAKENDIEFIELNNETAVYTDVSERCNKYTQTLFFDALGFNKQYQWYGSFDGTTDNAVALTGATKELINLHNYKSYPYYFCKCISTDICEEDDFRHEEIIYSTVCKNEDYASADYSKYNDAVEKANALDFSIYVDTSDLEQALLVDVSNLSSNEQNIVDQQTRVILDAIEALILKEKPTEPCTEPSTATTTESTIEATTEADKTTTQPTVVPTTELTTQPSTAATTLPTTASTTKPTNNATASSTTSAATKPNKNTSLISPDTGNSSINYIVVTSIIFTSALMLLLQKINKKKGMN